MSNDLVKDSYNIQDIIKILPNRYPFVLIDRIDEVKQGEYVNAIKNVTINEPFFSRSFPRSACYARSSFSRIDGTSYRFFNVT